MTLAVSTGGSCYDLRCFLLMIDEGSLQTQPVVVLRLHKQPSRAGRSPDERYSTVEIDLGDNIRDQYCALTAA